MGSWHVCINSSRSAFGTRHNAVGRDPSSPVRSSMFLRPSDFVSTLRSRWRGNSFRRLLVMRSLLPNKNSRDDMPAYRPRTTAHQVSLDNSRTLCCKNRRREIVHSIVNQSCSHGFPCRRIYPKHDRVLMQNLTVILLAHTCSREFARTGLRRVPRLSLAPALARGLRLSTPAHQSYPTPSKT